MVKCILKVYCQHLTSIVPYILYCFHFQDGTEKSKRVFVNVPTEVGQTEAEEIGVEHLLRSGLANLPYPGT